MGKSLDRTIWHVFYYNLSDMDLKKKQERSRLYNLAVRTKNYLNDLQLTTNMIVCWLYAYNCIIGDNVGLDENFRLYVIVKCRFIKIFLLRKLVRNSLCAMMTRSTRTSKLIEK